MPAHSPYKLLRSLAVFLAVVLAHTHGAAPCAVLAQQPAGPGGKETGVKPPAEPAGVRPPEDAAKGEPPPAGVRKAQGDVFYVRDAKGNLVLVPDLTFEELDRLIKLDRKLIEPGGPPRYSLGQLKVTGTVDKLRAQFEAQYTITPRVDEWLRVPLGFGEAVLRELPKAGSGELFVEYSAGEGYVAWLKAAKDKSTTITLRLQQAVTEAAAQQRLLLRAARATTSQLTLSVDTPQAVVTRSEAQAKPQGDQRSELSLLGLDEKTELGWIRSSARNSGVLEAVSEQEVRVEGGVRWTARSRIRLKSAAPIPELLHIRLPPDAHLAPVDQPAVRVRVLDAKEFPNRTTPGEMVEVKFERRTSTSEELRLSAEFTALPDKAAQQRELTGWEVLEAAQQSGTLDLEVEGEWQLKLSEGQNLHRVDDLPDPVRRNGVIARYEFVRQPCSLKAQAVRRTTIVSVEPLYLFSVQQSGVRMEARLKYHVRGAKITSLAIETPGWEIEPDGIEPAASVDLDRFDPKHTGPLEIPLAQPLSGEFEITVRARRAGDLAKELVTWPLPQPHAAQTAPAAVVILPDDNLELTPNAEKTTGLTVESVLPVVKLPSRQQPPLVYRAVDAQSAGVFSGSYHVHSRRVLVAADAQLRVGEEEVQVEQRFNVRVLYEGLSSLTFRGPASTMDAATIELLPDRKPLSFAPAKTTAPDTSGDVTRTVPLPGGPRLGQVEVVVRYRWQLPERLAETPQPASVPLLQSLDATGEETPGSTVRVTAGESIRCALSDDLWQVAPSPAAAPGGFQFAAKSTPPGKTLGLAVSHHAGASSSSAVVERCYAQLRLWGGKRQDRIVYRLTTAQRSLRILPPEAAAVGSLLLLVDGKPRPVVVESDRHLRIDLNGDGAPREYLIELEYACEFPSGGKKTSWFELPRILQDPWIRRCWVQVILRGDEHLWSEPGGLAGENVWQRRGWFWDRQTSLAPDEVEAFLGAAPAASPPEDANIYLFSALGPVDGLSLRTVKRRDLLLISSGVLLALGMALSYLPRLRHPLVLAALVTAGVVFAVSSPAMFLLATEMSVLGGVLLALALVLRWQLIRRGEKRPAVHGAWDSTLLPLSVGGGSSAAREGSSRVTTIAAPLHIRLGAPENKP